MPRPVGPEPAAEANPSVDRSGFENVLPVKPGNDESLVPPLPQDVEPQSSAPTGKPPALTTASTETNLTPG
jgi:hypothetical protein